MLFICIDLFSSKPIFSKSSDTNTHKIGQLKPSEDIMWSIKQEVCFPSRAFKYLEAENILLKSLFFPLVAEIFLGFEVIYCP